jgi:hypothetical protein
MRIVAVVVVVVVVAPAAANSWERQSLRRE